MEEQGFVAKEAPRGRFTEKPADARAAAGASAQESWQTSKEAEAPGAWMASSAARMWERDAIVGLLRPVLYLSPLRRVCYRGGRRRYLESTT